MILTIRRGSLVIPNPFGHREVLPGDTLVCFGKTNVLETLVPAKRAPQKPKRRPA